MGDLLWKFDTFFFGRGVDVARRRDVGRFHLKGETWGLPWIIFFGGGGVIFLCQRVLLRDGRVSYIRPVDGRLPVSMILVEPRGFRFAGKTMVLVTHPRGGQVALLVWKALCNLNARAVPWNSRREKHFHLHLRWVRMGLSYIGIIGTTKWSGNLGTKSLRTEFYIHQFRRFSAWCLFPWGRKNDPSSAFDLPNFGGWLPS